MNPKKAGLRKNPPPQINDRNIVAVYDYLNGIKILMHNSNNKEKIDLPPSNVLKFILADNISIVVRPSGTEPKLKVYVSIVSDSCDNSKKLADSFCDYFEDWF